VYTDFNEPVPPTVPCGTVEASPLKIDPRLVVGNHYARGEIQLPAVAGVDGLDGADGRRVYTGGWHPRHDGERALINPDAATPLPTPSIR